MSGEILTPLLTFLGGLFLTGGVGYLLIERLLDKNKNKEALKQQQAATSKDIIGNGVSMIELYKEVDQIVESKTKPLEDKIDILTNKIERFGCFRENCRERLRNELDSHVTQTQGQDNN